MFYWQKLVCTCFVYFIFSGSCLFANTTGESFYYAAEQGLKESKFDYSDALFQKAAAIFRARGQDSALAETQNKIASIELALAKEENALYLLSQNKDFIEAKFGSENELMCSCLDLLGDYYMMLSDAEVARAIYYKSYAIRLKLFGSNSYQVAISLSRLAGYHNFKINKDSAYYLSREAYEIYKDGQFDGKRNSPLNVLTQYAYATKVFETDTSIIKKMQLSRAIYFEALKVCEKWKSKNCIEYARILKDIGNTYTDETYYLYRNNVETSVTFEKAVQYYDSSLSILVVKLPKAHPQLSTIFFVKALVYSFCRDKNRTKNAIPYYKQAIQALFSFEVDPDNLKESDLARCTFKYDLINILGNKSANYNRCYVESHELNYLFKSYSDYKAQIILWRMIVEEFKSPYANRLIAIYNRNLFEATIAIAWNLYDASGDRKYLNDIYLYSELTKKSLRDKLLLQANNVKLIAKKFKQANIEDVQKKLKDKNTLFVEYYKENTIIAITKDTSLFIHLSDAIRADSLINKLIYEQKKNDAKNYSSTSNLIYRTFLLPAIEKCNVDVNELIISPDGELCKLSFASLNIGESDGINDFRKINYLIKKAKVRYVTSATDFINEEDDSTRYNGKMIVFSPDFIEKPGLPFSSRMINGIKKKIAGDFYSESEVNSDRIKSKAGGYSILHLSTHSEMDETGIGKLYLNPKYGQDTYLTIDSIYGYDIKTNLTVLSACNTNSGKYEFGEGALSFSRAFLTVGSQSTLTTMWSVDDKITNAILTDFYNDLFEEKSKSEALQNSQLNYLLNCKSGIEANPIFWSGLILTGSDSVVSLHPAENTHSIFIFKTLIVIVLLLLIFKRRGHRS